MADRGRRSIRIPGFDYSAHGQYFITVCAYRRRPILDRPGLREIVQSAWERLPGQFQGWVETDEFVIMPNHLRGIVVILPPDIAGAVSDRDGSVVRLRRGDGFGPATTSGVLSPGAGGCGPPRAPTLGRIVQWLKGRVTQEARLLGFADFAWQRNYWEHVIRSVDAFHTIRWYIRDNPSRWACDAENPVGVPDAREKAFLARFPSRRR
ncbi:MAG: hypothetical protein FJX75_08940 [Armatimonadetes bacterium]|nr:hypothetical protein [Armatimonadota bacterium]